MAKCTPYTHMHSERGTAHWALSICWLPTCLCLCNHFKGQGLSYRTNKTNEAKHPLCPGWIPTGQGATHSWFLSREVREVLKPPPPCLPEPLSQNGKRRAGSSPPLPHWGWSNETLWDLLWPWLCMKRALYVRGRPGQSQCIIMGQKQAKLYPVSWWH